MWNRRCKLDDNTIWIIIFEPAVWVERLRAPSGEADKICDKGYFAVRNSNPKVTCDKDPFIMRITLPPPHVSGPLHVEGNLKMTTVAEGSP